MERGASHGHALDPAHTPACALPLSRLVSPLCGAAPSLPGPRPEPTPCPLSPLLTSHYPSNPRPAAATRFPPTIDATPPAHVLTCLTHATHASASLPPHTLSIFSQSHPHLLTCTNKTHQPYSSSWQNPSRLLTLPRPITLTHPSKTHIPNLPSKIHYLF